LLLEVKHVEEKDTSSTVGEKRLGHHHVSLCPGKRGNLLTVTVSVGRNP